MNIYIYIYIYIFFFSLSKNILSLIATSCYYFFQQILELSLLDNKQMFYEHVVGNSITGSLYEENLVKRKSPSCIHNSFTEEGYSLPHKSTCSDHFFN